MIQEKADENGLLGAIIGKLNFNKMTVLVGVVCAGLRLFRLVFSIKY